MKSDIETFYAGKVFVYEMLLQKINMEEHVYFSCRRMSENLVYFPFYVDLKHQDSRASEISVP